MNENTEINKNKEKPAQTHKIGIYLWIWGLLFVLSLSKNVFYNVFDVFHPGRQYGDLGALREHLILAA